MKQLLLGLLLSALSAIAQAEEYAVIVNSDNIYRGSVAEAKNEIRLLYLKKKSKWSNELMAMPLGMEPNTGAHQAFVKDVLKMTPAQLSQHWAKVKQLNGTTPPRTVRSSRLMAKIVSRNPGAFGVVSKDFALNKLPKGTWSIFYFNDK